MNLRREQTMGKPFIGLYLESCKGHSHNRVAMAKALYWNKHFLMDALSSVNEHSMKNRRLLLLGLCTTVVLSGEASEIQLCCSHLE